MKITRYTLLLFLSLSVLSCSSDSDGEPFLLTNANIAGTYNITNYTKESVLTTEVTPGVIAPISTITDVGDTFQVNFTLEAAGTYTASGQYRIVKTVTPVVGNKVVTTSIANFTDNGTYSLNTANNTISLSASTDTFLSGVFTVTTFNETTLSLNQEATTFKDPITTNLKTTISFKRQ